MNYIEFKNLAKNRQACREFNDKEIELDTLNKIVEVARLTPSACNSQPWRMYLVYTKDKVNGVRDALTEGETRSLFLQKAKAFIVLAETKAEYKVDVQKLLGDNYFVKYDIGALASYITLSAKSLGVDSCIIGRLNKDILRESINLPENESCSIVVALGYSDIETREKIRKPIKEIIEYK